GRCQPTRLVVEVERLVAKIMLDVKLSQTGQRLCALRDGLEQPPPDGGRSLAVTACQPMLAEGDDVILLIGLQPREPRRLRERQLGLPVALVDLGQLSV